MKTIIAGSRDITDYSLVKYSVKQSGFNITEVVSGRCSSGEITFVTKEGIKVCGVDGLGEKWAEENNIPVKPFPADWKALGRSAGPVRNGEMAEYGESLILIWNGATRGSADMKNKWKDKQNNSFFFEFIVIRN